MLLERESAGNSAFGSEGLPGRQAWVKRRRRRKGLRGTGARELGGSGARGLRSSGARGLGGIGARENRGTGEVEESRVGVLSSKKFRKLEST